ncbi:hypothetical protein P4S72_11085 [Vibrio sp. PP-XX7]
MVIGMVIFCIAVIDQLIAHVFAGERLPQSDEEKLAHADHSEAMIAGTHTSISDTGTSQNRGEK